MCEVPSHIIIMEFVELCKKGDLDKVMAFLASHPCKDVIHFEAEKPIIAACKYGHLNIVMYIYYTCLNNSTLGPVDIHALHEGPFRAACSGGHLNIVKWLLHGIGTKINIHVMKNNAFRLAKIKGRVEVLKYLNEISSTY